jgi:hypothetical protein
VVLDGAEEGRIAERGLELGAFAEDVPQRLRYSGNEDKCVAREVVPLVADAGVIIGEQDATTLDGSARAGEGLGEVEGAVVVGQLFAGLDVADRDLEVVADGEAVGGAGVVEEAGVILAEDMVAASSWYRHDLR